MIDFADWIPGVCAALNAADTSDLVFWTEDELYQFASEAARRADRRFLLQAAYATAAADSGGRFVPEPTKQLDTIQVCFDGRVLAPACVAELEARDARWEETAAGTALAWCPDAQVGLIGLWPPPSSPGTVSFLYHRQGDDLSSSDAEIDAPEVFGDYLELLCLAGAREVETGGAMPESAAFYRGIASVMEEAFGRYFGRT